MPLKPNREIFVQRSKPLDPEVVKQYDRLSLNQALREGETQTPELKAVLDKVNFPLLKSIFQDIAQRCGVNPETLNFLNPERIFTQKKSFENSKGAYNFEKNIILLSDFKIPNDIKGSEKSGFKKRKINIFDFYGSLDIAILNFLIHEEVHATGKVLLSNPGEYALLNSVTGYNSIKSIEEGVYEDFFRGFNEGVTDLIKDQVLREYLARSMMPKEQSDAILKRLKDQEHRHGYFPERKLVEFIIQELANKYGQTKKVVWEAIVRGYFEGLDFNRQGIKNMFFETFGHRALKRIKQTSTKNHKSQSQHTAKETLKKLSGPFEQFFIKDPSTLAKLLEFFEELYLSKIKG